MRKAICGVLVLLFVVALAAAGNSGPAAASAATVFVEAGGGRDVAPPRAMYPSNNPLNFQVPGGVRPFFDGKVLGELLFD